MRRRNQNLIFFDYRQIYGKSTTLHRWAGGELIGLVELSKNVEQSYVVW